MVFLCGSLLGGLALRAESDYRTFTNKQGATIEARLLGLVNGEVEIERRDGARFTFPVEGLSAEDQRHVQQWSRLTLLRNSRSWEISARGSFGSPVREESPGLVKTTRESRYQISLENRTQEDFPGLTLRYRLFIRDTEASAVRERRSDRTTDGVIEIEPLAPRQTVVVETRSEPITENRVQPGWRWSSGAPPNSRDTLRGVYFEILYEGEVVQRFGQPSSLVEEMKETPFPTGPPPRGRDPFGS